MFVQTDTISLMADIRELLQEDAASFRALRLRALETDPGAFPGSLDEYNDELLSITGMDLSRKRGSSDDILLGAFMEQLVGTVGIERERSTKLRHKGRLWGTYVQPERRRLGIGRLLLSAVLEEVDHHMPGLEQIHADVSTFNLHAQQLLSAVGFIELCTFPRALLVDDQAVDQVRMVLTRDQGS